MSETVHIQAPLDDETRKKLRAGDRVLITGTILTARDAAHKRLCELVDAGKPLPIELRNNIIYYVGPSPARPGEVIGSAGPTTAYRMDSYVKRLLPHGYTASIGKGHRTPELRELMKASGAIYFAALGGTGALLRRSIVKQEIIAYEDLGPEAIRRLEVKDFTCVCINDTLGGDAYEVLQAEFRT